MILLRLSLLALAGTFAAAIEVDKSVLVLTEDNFDEAIKSHNRILVEFYAPWCGHCKRLAPEYEKAAERLEKEKSPIKLAKVDATVHKTLAGKYDVKGFPTLKWIANGATKEYNGPREAEGIYQWVQKQSGPAVKVLTTVDEALTFTGSANNVVVGFFKDVEGPSAKEFSQASTTIGDVPFAIVGDVPAVRSHFKAKRDGILMLKSSPSEKNVPFGGQYTAEEISKWAAIAAVPLIIEFSKETSSTIFGTDVQTFFILLISKSHEAFESSLAALRFPANIHKGNIIFVYVDADKESSAKQLEYVGVRKEDTPKYLMLRKDENAKYLSDKTSVDEQEVMDFVRSYMRGELTRSLKSQDLPKDWDKSPVKVLVSSNFDEVAKDKSKDAFVEFYAPWCGHCKKLAPVWDDLGKKFDGDDSVVIAKMDATANEIPGLEVKSFPTLKWFKRNTNEVVEYSGDRDLASLVKFVESNKPAKEDKKEEL